MTSGALLTAVVMAGYWTTGHWERSFYPDLAACEKARPVRELELAEGYGSPGVLTKCVEVKE
jgi:hypothetical protein